MLSFVKSLFTSDRSLDKLSRSEVSICSEETSDYFPINELPNEILVEIFEYLEPDDLNQCKLVCHRFLDIISIYPQLRPSLFFTNCVLAKNQPPVATFLNSFHELYFNSLTISDYYWNFENNFGNIDEFWELLSDSLTEFTLPDFLLMTEKEMLIMMGVVKKLKKLKRLTINKFILAELQNSTKLRSNFEFGNIDTVKLISLNMDLPYDWILDLFPNLRHIELEEFRASDEMNIRIFFEKYGAITKGVKKEQIPSVLYHINMDLSSLSTSIYTVEEFELFYEFIKRQTNLKDLELEMNFKRLIFQNLSCLKKLKVNFARWVCSTFEPFDDYQELKELSIYFGYKTDNEFFGHQILTNKSMRSVALHTRKIHLCPHCYKYMLMSYYNLRAIDIYTPTIIEYAEDLFHLFGRYGKNIEKINIRAARQLSLKGIFGYSAYLYNMPPLPKLREIELMPVGKISERWIQILCAQCPGLETVTLYDFFNMSGYMVKIFFSELKNLKSLVLANRKMESKYFYFALDSVFKYCRQLQRLRLACCQMDCDKMLKLFELSDRLEVVQDCRTVFYRKDYYLINVLKTKSIKDYNFD